MAVDQTDLTEPGTECIMAGSSTTTTAITATDTLTPAQRVAALEEAAGEALIEAARCLNEAERLATEVSERIVAWTDLVLQSPLPSRTGAVDKGKEKKDTVKALQQDKMAVQSTAAAMQMTVDAANFITACNIDVRNKAVAHGLVQPLFRRSESSSSSPSLPPPSPPVMLGSGLNILSGAAAGPMADVAERIQTLNWTVEALAGFGQICSGSNSRSRRRNLGDAIRPLRRQMQWMAANLPVMHRTAATAKATLHLEVLWLPKRTTTTPPKESGNNGEQSWSGAGDEAIKATLAARDVAVVTANTADAIKAATIIMRNCLAAAAKHVKMVNEARARERDWFTVIRGWVAGWVATWTAGDEGNEETKRKLKEKEKEE